MNHYSLRFSVVGVAAALLAIPCFALSGNAAMAQTTQNAELMTGTAQLVQKLDAKNAKAGELVTAKLTSNIQDPGSTGAFALPKGTLLMGKVEDVKASGNHGPSSLSLVFNEAKLKNGKTVPIKVTLIGAHPAPNAGNWDGTYSYLGGAIPKTVSASQKFDQGPGTLNHVGMHSAVQSQDSAVFTSQDRNVELKPGTRLQVAVAPLQG